VTVRQVVARPARVAARGAVRLRTRGWPAHTRLFAVGERTGWSVDEDARHLEATARRLGYEVAPAGWARFCGGQSVFVASHFDALLGSRWLDSSHRLATAYLHGRPGTPGYPEFDRAYEALRTHADRFDRIQVTHAEMQELVLSAGVDPARVFRIPIGIDLEHFPLVDAASRRAAREALGVPRDAFVVGSFQKDGVGWGEGLEPKLVKGPDVLIAVLEQVNAAVPELFVVLTGPARGFVRSELERLSIPYRHVLAKDRSELAGAYRALDAYVLTSRQEGGPKAMLESLASGVPFVSTRVGQVQELASDGTDALVVDVDDIDALVGQALRVRDDPELASALRRAGRPTAERYAYERLDPAWQVLLDGLLDNVEAARVSLQH
jgi:glycosyltransferase involved in cell wall biosynthesis